MLHTFSKVLPALTHLFLAKNFLGDSDSVGFLLRQPLCELLEWLDLSDNLVRKSIGCLNAYNEWIFERIISLRVLDGVDRD